MYYFFKESVEYELTVVIIGHLYYINLWNISYMEVDTGMFNVSINNIVPLQAF